MERSYWQQVLSRRIGRRRALMATGTVGVASAFLAACGGDDDSGGGASTGAATGTTAASGLVTQPVETTDKAQRGGTLKWFVGSEPANLDVFLDQAPKNVHKNMVYGHYVNEKPGYLTTPAYEEIIPEMMESWEFSGDGLQVTFKMRKGVKFHNKPPVNGRLMDTEDVLFSWQRFSETGTDRRFLSNAANPDAPVLSVEAPDDETIVFNLQEPVVFLLPALTPAQTGKPSIIPKETDSTFDIRSDMIGTGPFMLESYAPTVGFTYKRNPDYYDKDFPLIDTIEMPLIPEYAAALAQVKAGSIYSYSAGNSVIQAEDLVPLKNDVPDLVMMEAPPTGFSVRSLIFGWPATEENKPFKDERVRQAVQMSWDRDAYIDAFNNVSGLEADGLPVTTYWNTAVAAGSGSWWLDPQSSEFGPNAKYMKRDIAEAKKLLEAAGYADGIDVTSSYIGGPQLGADFQRSVGVCDEFSKEAGFRPTAKVIDYTSEYVPNIRDSNGKFDGWAYRAGGSPANDAVAYFSTLYHSRYGGPGFLGFDSGGKGDGSGDPELESLLNKARAETDIEERRELVYEIQRHLAKAAYAIPHPPGTASFFYLAWPALQNFQVYQGDRRQQPYHWWIDPTKAPLA
jgi:peptide/nickel transport system substrate-binding protein